MRSHKLSKQKRIEFLKRITQSFKHFSKTHGLIYKQRIDNLQNVGGLSAFSLKTSIDPLHGQANIWCNPMYLNYLKESFTLNGFDITQTYDFKNWIILSVENF